MPSNNDADIEQLKRDVEELKRQRISLSLDTGLDGMFDIVSVVPTGVPHTVYDQVKIYTNSTTYRLYWYDWNAHAWHYINATA